MPPVSRKQVGTKAGQSDRPTDQNPKGTLLAFPSLVCGHSPFYLYKVSSSLPASSISIGQTNVMEPHSTTRSFSNSRFLFDVSLASHTNSFLLFARFALPHKTASSSSSTNPNKPSMNPCRSNIQAWAQTSSFTQTGYQRSCRH